jgi:uncharacterized membrane protein YfcA
MLVRRGLFGRQRHFEEIGQSKLEPRARSENRILHDGNMNFLHAISLPYVLSGFGVGFLVGMTGVGGGSLMTPILILLFGISPEKAVTTDLIYASITKTGGSFVHGVQKTIDWRVVGRLASGSIPAAIVTLSVLYYLGLDSGATNALITKVLGAALLLTAICLIFRRWLMEVYSRRVGPLSRAQTVRYTVITGAVLGTLVSISSVGAGALGVTALILLYPELPIVRIAGSDIAHAVPLTLVAGIGHMVGGTISPIMLGSLLLGSLPGVVLSSYVAPKVPDSTLRIVLAVTLLLVGGRLLA